MLGLADEPILHPRMFGGLADTLRLILEDASGVQPTAVARACKATCRAWRKRIRLRSRRRTRSSPCSHARSAKSKRASIRTQALRRGAGRTRPGLQTRAALDDRRISGAVARGTATPRTGGEVLAPGGIPTLAALAKLGNEAGRRARERIDVIERLAAQADELGSIEYDFLYDEERHLLAIGFNVTERRRDAGYLRSARLGGAVHCFRRHLAAQAAAGELVCARPSSHEHRWRDRRSCHGAARCSST